MTNPATEAKEAQLKRMGLDRHGLKKGSRFWPFLLLVGAIWVFVGHLKPSAEDELRWMKFDQNSRSNCSAPREKFEIEAADKIEAGRKLLSEGTTEAVNSARANFKSAASDDPNAVKCVGETWYIVHRERGNKLRIEGKEPEAKAQDLLADKKQLALITSEEDKESINRVSNALFNVAEWWRGVVNEVEGDLRTIVEDSLWTAVWLLLFSLIPGLAGLVYRRAFWFWFVMAFLILLTINVSGSLGTISGVKLEKEHYNLYIVASLGFLFFLALLLRRHASGMVTMPPIVYTLRNGLLAVFLIAVGLAYSGAWSVPGLSSVPYVNATFNWFQTVVTDLYKWAAIVFGLPALYVLFRKRVLWTGGKPKNIVVCLDGTWNTPGMTDFGQLTQTNVFKLFQALKEDKPPDRPFLNALRDYVIFKKMENAFWFVFRRKKSLYEANICKRYTSKENRNHNQIAYYYNGVGNKMENSEIGQFFGGTTGWGASSIVERAYLDIVRVYQPGDRIYIFGFSRGAAIARLLARAIDQRGVPKRIWTLRLLGRHWVVWKSARQTSVDGNQQGVPISVLGCWDTVGSFGLAKPLWGINFQKIDLFKDLTVPDNVEQAYHMVALDEERDAFEPTLMDLDPFKPDRIIEVWFAGNHAGVGGGYATDHLSDVTLDFLLRHVSSGYFWDLDDSTKPGDETWGLYLHALGDMSAGSTKEGTGPSASVGIDVYPNPKGQLRTESGIAYDYVPRKLPLHAVIHESVFERMRNAVQVYAPQSLFKHNQELIKALATIKTEVGSLLETKSIHDNERNKILEESERKLTLAKWPPNGRTSRSWKTPPELTSGLRNPPAPPPREAGPN